MTHSIKGEGNKDMTDLIKTEMENQGFREMESISNQTTSFSRVPIMDFSSFRNPPPSYSDDMKNDSAPPDYSESF